MAIDPQTAAAAGGAGLEVANNLGKEDYGKGDIWKGVASAGIHTALKGVGKLLGGGGGDKSKSYIELPVEMQLDLLDQHQTNIERLRESQIQIDNAFKAYDDRVNFLTEAVEGSIPSERVVKQLNRSSARIALALGQDAQRLQESGYLEPDDIERLQELDDLNSKEYVNYAFEEDMKSRRELLEQQAYRQNLSQSERQMILTYFDIQSNIERQQVTESMRQAEFSRGMNVLSATAQLRQQGLQNVFGMYGTQRDLIGEAQQGYGILAGLNQQRLSNVAGMAELQTGLGQAAQDQFRAIGEYKWDNTAKKAIEMGIKGPGSKADQLRDTAMDPRIEQQRKEEEKRRKQVTASNYSPFGANTAVRAVGAVIGKKKE